jgi:phenylalanyl-tRNA synthetase beta chain
VLAWPEKRPANFYAASRLLLALVDWLELEPLELDAPPARLPAWAHPEVAAGLRVADRHVGLLYRLHPDFQHALELRSDVLAFDLDFDALFDCPRREIRWRPLPRFPDVPFDVSVVVPERTEARELERLVREAAGGLLRRVTVFDVYQGKGVPAGKKSLSLHLVFRSDERTLAARDVEALERGVVERLARAGYPLR